MARCEAARGHDVSEVRPEVRRRRTGALSEPEPRLPRRGEAGRPLFAIVLAAGEGTRMRSSRPKPLHRLCGRPMLLYVLDGLRECAVRRAVIVVGHGAERVTKKLQESHPDLLIEFVEQHRQRGTGDAVSVGLTAFSDDEIDASDADVLVLPGDTPLLGRPRCRRWSRSTGAPTPPAPSSRRTCPTRSGTAGSSAARRAG